MVKMGVDIDQLYNTPPEIQTASQTRHRPAVETLSRSPGEIVHPPLDISLFLCKGVIFCRGWARLSANTFSITSGGVVCGCVLWIGDISFRPSIPWV